MMDGKCSCGNDIVLNPALGLDCVCRDWGGKTGRVGKYRAYNIVIENSLPRLPGYDKDWVARLYNPDLALPLEQFLAAVSHR